VRLTPAFRPASSPLRSPAQPGAKRSHRDGDVDLKLYALKLDQAKGEMERFYGDQRQHLWGNQIRSYVFQPYRMVKDLRTGEQSSDVQAVMDGALDPFVNACSAAGCPLKRVQA